MNDLHEVRFGMYEGARLVNESKIFDQTFTPAAKAQYARDVFVHFFTEFENEHAFDTYVFCLSEHDPSNTDGLLSMWRGYGGQGNGAALIFSTDLINADNPQSPLLITKLHYASQ